MNRLLNATLWLGSRMLVCLLFLGMPSTAAAQGITTGSIAGVSITERLATEIALIKRMKYPGYFLIVWDFIRYAREKGIPVGPGRGSAAGSLVVTPSSWQYTVAPRGDTLRLTTAF